MLVLSLSLSPLGHQFIILFFSLHLITLLFFFPQRVPHIHPLAHLFTILTLDHNTCLVHSTASSSPYWLFVTCSSYLFFLTLPPYCDFSSYYLSFTILALHHTSSCSPYWLFLTLFTIQAYSSRLPPPPSFSCSFTRPLWHRVTPGKPAD